MGAADRDLLQSVLGCFKESEVLRHLGERLPSADSPRLLGEEGWRSDGDHHLAKVTAVGLSKRGQLNEIVKGWLPVRKCGVKHSSTFALCPSPDRRRLISRQVLQDHEEPGAARPSGRMDFSATRL